MAEASGISREEVAGIARLARIAVSDEELDQLAGQLDTIVEAVSAVQAVDTEGVEPMSHPHSVEAAMREDVQRITLTQAQALDQAPEVEDDRFMVPQILGEED
ncbi:Asp-tRNA(Asn)/Glu-tRNA(Gln) amidotransferase subunit GatC [Corynebacterium sp. p3-SID1145]|uniref:Asp-tRNA(Asn)/Glu-tRNA(Gln) amidotransferase subunit GatC n=1 Tax=unclassified Corynebacterium TaxID=2624378 RepID=UPI0021AAE9CC|nr:MULTISPECIES: Asp-tRNA(Asn)/Glu-tRNA(Gln) amidotransferase subunit GatC [unclassified Corynebacterium]MCT1452504.1 Asp-tRNA(Asn)/Glu-tRNA(Gln) amidotransferase subunit GatC [Corynebacterium sp. p3-SID1145]MCT1461406.1 Asp-tRNA(Asn)/Glu-tRNA(Gln) amidotransferase subunit GatC [Corynebacterium sp. p3-SID1140]